MTHPLLYEINTRCWLREISEREGRAVTLADVPDEELTRWRDLGFSHIWLMGIWTTGARSREVALADQSLRQRYDEILPGWSRDDVPGSPYGIGAYEVPAALGGNGGLQKFRARLNSAGIKLLLDFVPNHLGLDFEWVTKRPELLVQGPPHSPGTFEQQTVHGPRWIAHGKDPYFPPFADTVQVEYRRADARAAMIELLQSVARQCDGVRCDLAMLPLNDIFAKTWAHLPGAGPAPVSEFWADAIAAVKKSHPGFLFLAEAYWGLEARLQSLGFDYTYDKTVYDRLIDRNYGALQKYLFDTPREVLERGAHFLENHDERRIATVFNTAEHRAVALLMLGLPGMRFLYEGELHGRRAHVPVQLGRCPKENFSAEISVMYQQLLGALKYSAVGRGDWKILRPETRAEDAAYIYVIQWQRSALELDLVAVNLASHPIQCRVRPVIKFAARDWNMRDLLRGLQREVHGVDLETRGLEIDLLPHATGLLHISTVGPR